MLADFETRILTKIDDMVEHASDDELFAGGYLRGHLTLAVAELEQENETSVDALYQRVEESIQQAIKGRAHPTRSSAGFRYVEILTG